MPFHICYYHLKQNHINNFIIFIKNLIKIKDEENPKIDENTKIFEIADKINGLHDDFKNMFKEKNDLTVNKISNIYLYYLKLIFKYVKDYIIQYQEKISNKDNKDIKEGEKENLIYFSEKKIKKLDEIFSKKDIIIKKESLSTALRLFITIVLYRENDKESKIRQNTHNIVEYLEEKDLWENQHIDIKDETFHENLKKIINHHLHNYHLSHHHLKCHYLRIFFLGVRKVLQQHLPL